VTPDAGTQSCTKLKPHKDPITGKLRVNVIAELSPLRKRERRLFNTQAAALECIEELKARRDNIAAIPTLSVSDLLDAAAALELLGDLRGVTLVQPSAPLSREKAHAVLRFRLLALQPIP
jgi:hypothetical protein